MGIMKYIYFMDECLYYIRNCVSDKIPRYIRCYYFVEPMRNESLIKLFCYTKIGKDEWCEVVTAVSYILLTCSF